MVRVRVLIVALAVIAGMATVALAATGGGVIHRRASSGPFQVDGWLTASGNPEPAVVGYPDQTEGDMHWSMCRPPAAGACEAIPSKDGEANPGPEPAGTVFRLDATYQGQAYTTTLTWRGALGVTQRPALSGQEQYDATVTSSAARWTGGWGTAFEQLGVEACRTAAGSDCVMLSGDQLECRASGCGSLGGPVGLGYRPNRARIGDWCTGWYLFALDAHRADGSSLDVGFRWPAAVPAWPTNVTVARSKPYGPVTGPAAPRVRFLRDAQADDDHVVFASVRCSVSCHVWMTVTGIGRHSTGIWSASTVIKGLAAIGVKGRIPPGRVAVAINVDDGPILHGHSVIQ